MSSRESSFGSGSPDGTPLYGMVYPSENVDCRFEPPFESMTLDNSGRFFLVEYSLDADFFRERGIELTNGSSNLRSQKYYKTIKQGEPVFPPPIDELRDHYLEIACGEHLVGLQSILSDYDSGSAMAYIRMYLSHLINTDRDMGHCETMEQFIAAISPEDIVRKALPILKICEVPRCEGCRYNAPGQHSHMENGGCLYVESSSL